MDTSALDRARELATVLTTVGSNWPHYLPHDASLSHDATGPFVWLQGVRLWPTADSWVIEHSSQVWIVRAKGRAA